MFPLGGDGGNDTRTPDNVQTGSCTVNSVTFARGVITDAVDASSQILVPDTTGWEFEKLNSVGSDNPTRDTSGIPTMTRSLLEHTVKYNLIPMWICCNR
jgi:hypothetical protein